uniref:NADH-ubiquinone oxidoreductase chain 4L n=1 Tax=Neoscona multiplicans TaxID=1112442 RepID=A0A5B7M120_9ARAC|nr:NADH dehydrogenase subunit 4L [Neoscona multiplicans]QCF46306.1 NADH dehydrogenase subunit 4L [Neoscona multiplicans]
MNSIKIMILIGITSLLWWRKNIIILLLSLELMLMSIFTLIAMKLFLMSPISIMIMLTIMVAGSSLGLVLMVSLCRFFKSPNALPMWLLI